MSKERVIKLTDGTIVDDQKAIDRFMAERKAQFERKKSLPLADVLRGVNLREATLSREQREPIGVLEVSYGGDDPFPSQLYNISDLTLDLTPQAGDYPRMIASYRLAAQNTQFLIDVLYDSTDQEYWKYYGEDKKLDELIRNNLMIALQKNNWTCDWTGAWSVVEQGV